MRSNLIGIDAHHEVGDVIVDLGKPMPGAGGNNHDVTGLELVGDAIANRGGVAARPVEHLHGVIVGWSALCADKVGAGDERRRAVDDVIDLAHLVVFGNGVGRRLFEFAAIDDANVHVGLPSINRANLLIDYFFGDGPLLIGLNLLFGNVG